jgi:hypothetical protein
MYLENIYKRILLCASFLFVYNYLHATHVDTIQTNIEGTTIMIEKNDILYAKEGNPIKKYVFSEIIHSSELKLMLDSCVWENYYEGKIKQGHVRIFTFILFDKHGKLEHVCVSKPFAISDESFFNQLTPIIIETIEEHPSLWKKSKRSTRKNACYYTPYRLNLYP